MKNRVLFGTIAAVLLSPTLALAESADVTDCTDGCTVVTCDESICAVNVFDEKAWSIVATYEDPSSDGGAGPARYRFPGKPQAPQEEAPSTRVIAATDANNQLAKVCDTGEVGKCTLYKVSVEGAIDLGEI